MNKSESKYFNTARRMDEAFLELLSQKDLAYITVKEICEKAGVNRSTFYLHYETLGDLLSESIEYMNERFESYMLPDAGLMLDRLRDCPLDELDLISPQYLRPYLNYVKENKRLMRLTIENPGPLRQREAYDRMFTHVFTPILERFQVPSKEHGYIMAFYIHGLIAIVSEWIQEDCAAPVEDIIDVIQRCVRWYEPGEAGPKPPFTKRESPT